MEQSEPGSYGMSPAPGDVLARLDADIDAIFKALDELRTKCTPFLMEPSPEVASIDTDGPPRTPLEAAVFRMPVILGQIRDLTRRMVP